MLEILIKLYKVIKIVMKSFTMKYMIFLEFPVKNIKPVN